ncbi:MAG TPA: SDR family oxidoreductase [Anaerolineaceae bacterium]|nr:SDR family oxidoreductase [Anaerolineaceae bacterium]
MAIQNKVTVISGATGGLGRVVAREFAEQGAKLVLVGTNAERLAQLVAELKLNPESYVTVVADLTQSGAAQEVLEAALEKFGRVDILFNFIGGWIAGKPVPEVPPEEVENMLAQHFWTSFNLAQAFIPHMLENHWGRYVVISTPGVGAPPANSLPYTTGKAAEETLMLTLAEELKHTGVTANVLRVRSIDVEHKREREPSPKNASWTTPDEIAAALLYLCSDEANRVNGARIPLYGAP